MIPYIRHVRVGKVMEKDVGLACMVESEDHLLMDRLIWRMTIF